MIAWIRRFRTATQRDRRRSKWSLRYKFIATLALFTVVLSISFGLLSVYRLNAELEDQLLQRGRVMANDLILRFWGPGGNQPADKPSDESPDKSLQQLILSVALATVGEDILYVQVVRDGEILTATSKIEDIARKLNLNSPESIVHLLPDAPGQVAVRKTLFDGTPYLDFIKSAPQPLIQLDPQLTPKPLPSYVRLGLSLAAVQAQVRREFAIMAGLAALYILIGLGLAFWLYKSILGPIEVLTDSVKRFKRDRHARAQVTTGDELQTLAEEFNRMADTIQERDERLECINEQLRRANRVKSEFLAVMGHELKTPLHAIRGYAQLLLEGIDGPITEAQREDLENILKSGDHLRELIDNVLQFSKIESGEEELHPTRIEVRQLLEEALQNVKVLAREKALDVQIQAESFIIEADETKLKQVLINLLSNALKYTSEGQVTVRVESRDGEVLFAVQDTGIGIPREAQASIFEPFTQLDSSSTRQWGGIGLGLSIVKRYVEMHGGRVWVESEPGRGSTFYVAIPQPLPSARPHASSNDENDEEGREARALEQRATKARSSSP